MPPRRTMMSSDQVLSQPPAPGSERDMKRASARLIIERYFFQLKDGCGDNDCLNAFCASSGKVRQLSPNEAAGLAIQLFKNKVPQCDILPSKVPRTSRTRRNVATSVSSTTPSSSKRISWISEEDLIKALESCESLNNTSSLQTILLDVFSTHNKLGRSFLKTQSRMIDYIPPSQLANMLKEQVRALEGESEKDIDSSLALFSKLRPPECLDVDMRAIQRIYSRILSPIMLVKPEALVEAFISLADAIDLELKITAFKRGSQEIDTMYNSLLITMEAPPLPVEDYMSSALPKLCLAISKLPIRYQAKMARTWAINSQTRMPSLLHGLHTIITERVMRGKMTVDFSAHSDEIIEACTKTMKLVFYASVLAGEIESPYWKDEDEALYEMSYEQEEPLAKELQVNLLYWRKSLIPFPVFYNDPLSDAIEMDKDYTLFKTSDHQEQNFSFMSYSFILTPATKTLGLYYDSRIKMYAERRVSFLQTVVGQPTTPYLRLKVHRDRIIEDALVELELVADDNPKDLKKQLVVEFDGEQGVDEGGVSKEFFQLVIEEIFNPDYGMFIHQEGVNTMWFNSQSFESSAQFTLIGVIIGLAIYNNVILDVHFPMVVYKKLMGKRGTFHDLQDWDPTIYNSLVSMLEYGDSDFTDVFMQTFKVSYRDMFGNVVEHDLIPDGGNVFVTNSNKEEFANMYADFLLNSSIETQFSAFLRGFRMVTDESPLHLLFRPEEIEELVCGSKTFNLKELEDVTDYDGGYTPDSKIVKYFWEIIHSMTKETQRKVLQFATGSDRVPVGGLSKLKLVIARNGPDSERLPTAHTCFNVLLLPEYSSKEKLQDRLLKAINYSKGFGMI